MLVPARDQTSYLPNCHRPDFFFLFLKRMPEDMPDEVSHHFSDPVVLMNISNTKRTRLSPALGHTHSSCSLERENRWKKGQDALHSGQQPLPEKPCPATCYRRTPASVDQNLHRAEWGLSSEAEQLPRPKPPSHTANQ